MAVAELTACKERLRHKDGHFEVHGIFSIHGTDHELTAPAEVEMRPDGWSATVHFAIPYVKWGRKNPSILFLRVSESVEIDWGIGGVVTKQVVK